MAIGLLGRKVGMTQIFDEGGRVIPVTVIQAGPCHVLQLRTQARDGYEAVQVGFDDLPRRTAARSQRGHVARLDSKRARRLSGGGVELPEKPDCEPKRFVREFRLDSRPAAIPDGMEVHAEFALPEGKSVPASPADATDVYVVEFGQIEVPDPRDKKKSTLIPGYGAVTVGQELKAAIFKHVRQVDVTGVTKGRGTAGYIKRHGFKGQRATHGVKKVHRHSGGTSANTSPGRVIKGKKMPGRYGNEQCTMRNLDLVRVDEENGLLLVRGAVPGPRGGYVIVRETNKV